MDELFDLLREDEDFFDICQTARLESYPYNLVQSGDLEEYCKLLAGFDFLAEKINHPEFGVQALIADYDLIDDPPLGRQEPPQPPLLSRAVSFPKKLLMSRGDVSDRFQFLGSKWSFFHQFYPQMAPNDIDKILYLGE